MLIYFMLMNNVNIIIKEWIDCNNSNMWLDLRNLDLNELPEIPDNCKKLNCSGNKLTKLPDILFCTDLYCSDNKIIKLPYLPFCLYAICDNNEIIELPDKNSAPKLEFIRCNNNKILCVPENTNYRFWCDGNYFMRLTVNQFRDYMNHHIFFDDEWFRYRVNYSRYAKIIQNKYRDWMRNKIFIELNKLYIKNMAKMISYYVI